MTAQNTNGDNDLDDLTGGVATYAQAAYASSTQALDDTTGGVVDRAGVYHPQATIGVASDGVSVTTYYKKRARDSACGSPTYVTWVTTNSSQSYPGALPCGGPLVEEIIADLWQL